MLKGSFAKTLLAGVAGGAIALGGTAVYQEVSGQNMIGGLSTTSSINKVNVSTSTDTTKAIQKVSNAVVSVLNYQAGSSSSDAYSQLFGESSNSSAPQLAGEGSGVIYRKDGNTAYIVTNNHVIENAVSLEVLMPSGQKVKATVVGNDAYSDLAVLKIDAKYVKDTATFANSSQLTVGEPAIAVGSPLGSDYANSATEGIVSALNRNVQMQNEEGQNVSVNAIQTDAAINPGNSGGALINISGQVIGITSSKISSTADGTSSGVSVEGMGFAIPSDDVTHIISQLEKDGKIIRPAMGVKMVALTNLTQSALQSLNLPDSVTTGVVIASTQAGMPAANAGLKSNDVITKIGDTSVSTPSDLQSALYKYSLGDSVSVTYYRDGKSQTTQLKLNKTTSDLKQ
jgi:serine protease Do